MTPQQPSALAVAHDHAALTNRISMLLASQSSVLQTMNLGGSSRNRRGGPGAAVAASDRDSPSAADNDDDLWRDARPNEGVGYAGAAGAAAAAAARGASRQDQVLRGRLLADKKKGGQGPARSAAVQESSEDEDQGRTALGKRKRSAKSAAGAGEGRGGGGGIGVVRRRAREELEGEQTAAGREAKKVDERRCDEEAEEEGNPGRMDTTRVGCLPRDDGSGERREEKGQSKAKRKQKKREKKKKRKKREREREVKGGDSSSRQVGAAPCHELL